MNKPVTGGYSYRSRAAEGIGWTAALGYSLSVLRSLPDSSRRAMLALLLVPLVIGLLIFAPVAWPANNDSPGEGYPGGLPAAPGGGSSTGSDVGAPTEGATTDIPSAEASGNNTPSTDASQAAAFEALIEQAGRDRERVRSAVADLQECGSTAGISRSVDVLNEVADNRVSLADLVDAASVDQIGDGDRFVQLLSEALRKSAEADRAFAAWGEDLEADCSTATSTHNANYRRGFSASKEATQYKDEFIDVWNPVASAYGLSQRTSDDI
jgi:hypothetical protein